MHYKQLLPYSDRLLVMITAGISLAAFLYFYFHGHENLSYYDAIARLNTARKMIDSLTPGIGQLGGIWLPFPQLLMLPFIWNDFLWHSGIAGYIVSGISFIVGAVYLQKTVYLMTNRRKIALLIWFVFVSNINILLLQTMAMSEPFFLCFFILTCYYLLLWVKTHTTINFLQTAFCVMILTLTRYEGYFIFLGVLAAIGIECMRKYTLRQRERIEGMLLLFLTIAGFGIILWCIYTALFYKDPLFWLHAYTPPPASALQSTSVITQVYGIVNPTLPQALAIYASVVLWTNGIITVVLGLAGLIRFWFRPNRMFFSLFIVTSVLFLLLVIGYYKSFIPTIEFPPVLLTGVHTRMWSVYADNNVRYGIVLLPAVLLFAAIAAARSKVLFVVATLFVCEQVFFSVVNPQLLQYPFYKSWRYPNLLEASWFKQHYDGGLILIAASAHEDFMFQTGLAYKHFIYEGTRQYWYESLNHPSTYARWVIFDASVANDDVTLGLTQQGIDELKNKFQLVYKKNGFSMYHLACSTCSKSESE